MGIRHIFKILLLAMLSLAISWGISRTKAIDSFESWTYDLRQIAFAPQTDASKDIVMVWLDETTMKSLAFRSPVPRDFLAKLNTAIVEAEPKLIAYDIFLKDPSYAESDKLLAESLQTSPIYAVVPMRIDGCVDNVSAKDGCVDLPLPLFYDSLKAIGLADLPFNAFDSVVRNTKFSFETNLGKTPTLASLLYNKATNKDANELINNKDLWPGFGVFKLTPFIKNKETFIRFAGLPSKIGSKTNTFSVYPAHLVAKGLIPKAWLKDKIILVGASYEDLQDAFITPYYASFTNYARMNGVEIHANILSSLLTGQFYHTLENWQMWTVIGFVILIIIASTSYFSILKSALILILITIVHLFTSILLFKKSGIIIPVITPIVGTVISYGLGTSWKALIEGKQKRWIKGVFSQYVPPAVVKQMTENPDLLKLGGEQRIVTSLFSDIASFTSISEKMDPTTLVQFLNEYLTMMNEILFKYGGTIDKYEGDAIIAFFNAPVDLPNHQMAAIKSAIEMQNACTEITKKWKERLGFSIVTRVGINTGPAVVGNIGSQDRFDYTAIGDTINLASRLEGTNKFYNTILMASETTVADLDNSIIRRPIDKVRVKGKSKPILLYEILQKDKVDLSKDFTLAFEKFNKKNFNESEKILKKILEQHKDDGPSKELLKSIKKARQEPDWDLITDLLSK